jgi:hypothetical protein
MKPFQFGSVNRLALQLAVPWQSIAQAFELAEAEATPWWDKIAVVHTHGGRHPRRRSRLYVLDPLRGRRRQLLARKKADDGDASHWNLRAGA